MVTSEKGNRKQKGIIESDVGKSFVSEVKSGNGSWVGGIVVDLGMAFVDNWVVVKEKAFYWLSNDIVGLVGNLVV